MIGATLSFIFKKVTFYNYILGPGDLADQPGSEVDVRRQRFRIRYRVVTYTFSFFFNLVEKNSLIVKKIFKCRENGIDCLRNRQLQRRIASLSYQRLI